jgi:hypothetical protein
LLIDGRIRSRIQIQIRIRTNNYGFGFGTLLSIKDLIFIFYRYILLEVFFGKEKQFKHNIQVILESFHTGMNGSNVSVLNHSLKGDECEVVDLLDYSVVDPDPERF